MSAQRVSTTVSEPALLTGLHRDHANTALALKLLDAEAEVLMSSGSPDYGLILDIMEYFVTFPDEYHHRNEDLLFERLLRTELPVAGDVQTLMDQHVELAQVGRALIETINQVLDGGMIQRSEVCAAVTAYSALLRGHMRLEDGVVFPAAQECLVDDDWQRLDEIVAQRDDPLFGDVIAQRFTALAERLEALRRS